VRIGDDQYGSDVTADEEGLFIETWYESGTSWTGRIPWKVVDELRAGLAETNLTEPSE
jgi:hypothetical protein